MLVAGFASLKPALAIMTQKAVKMRFVRSTELRLVDQFKLN
jgi:hypothetical protein